MPGYSAQKEAYILRLRRIEGQTRGLQNMVTEDRYCIDILTQISAVTGALQSLAVELLDQHMNHCVRQAVEGGDPEADTKIREASDAIARLVRNSGSASGASVRGQLRQAATLLAGLADSL